MKIGITGAAGLLGLKVAQELQQNGYQVKGAFRNTPPNESVDIEWVSLDIMDVMNLETFVQDCDVIVHCAAIVSFKKEFRDELYDINVEGTSNVVNVLLGKPNKKLIHISSVAAFGRLPNKLINEKAYWNEELAYSHYGKSKFLAEMEIQRGLAEGLQAMILNPSFIMGKSADNRSSSDLWSQIKFLPSIAPMGGNGYVDVQDVAVAVKQCLEHWESGQQYIISGHNASYHEIYSLASGRPEEKIKTLNPRYLLFILPFLRVIFFLIGKSTVLSRDSILTASKTYRYDNQKSLEKLKMEYTSLEESVASCVS